MLHIVLAGMVETDRLAAAELVAIPEAQQELVELAQADKAMLVVTVHPILLVAHTAQVAVAAQAAQEPQELHLAAAQVAQEQILIRHGQQLLQRVYLVFIWAVVAVPNTRVAAAQAVLAVVAE